MCMGMFESFALIIIFIHIMLLTKYTPSMGDVLRASCLRCPYVRPHFFMPSSLNYCTILTTSLCGFKYEIYLYSIFIYPHLAA